ncbi:hypothetical protein AJ80_06116 [Polytolypa hystricis UAMH7299]|uniref:Uncharacterized protein n=1 Tax=Polytolypa hystricis (strain UAMH7299) TaxID=1447883 RepID=A0A2B7XXN4_POLH7|nr:hypothetical protein AJ80_06116 [Polytolypa hystricis UAMH7299]
MQLSKLLIAIAAVVTTAVAAPQEEDGQRCFPVQPPIICPFQQPPDLQCPNGFYSNNKGTADEPCWTCCTG